MSFNMQAVAMLKQQRHLYANQISAFLSCRRWLCSDRAINQSTESSVKPYLPWEENRNAECQFGILKNLAGKWVNWKGGPTGMHTTILPSPGTSAETIFGIFHFKAQEYREKLDFTMVNEAVRNRGGSNEQFNGALKYNTAIIDNDDVLQHFENGMYIWLGDNSMPWNSMDPYQNPPTMFSHRSTSETVKDDDADPVIGPNTLGPQFVPPYSISRQGVIPHGTTIHLTGNVAKSNASGEAPHIAHLWEQQYLAVSPTMGINPSNDLYPNCREKPEWTNKPRAEQEGGGVNSGRAYFQKIFNYDKYGATFPYTVQPNLKLIDANQGLQFQSYDLIELDTFHDTGIQGGVINNVMIERYCKVVRMRHRMWLEQVYHNGNVIDQLQYEQIVDFEFMFGTNGSTTRWPHIQVNTLRRESDLTDEELLPDIVLPTNDGTRY